MKREHLAAILTVGLLLAVSAFAVFKRMAPRLEPAYAPKAAQPVTPEDTIYAMMDAAHAGNTKAYLNQYTGEMRAALDRVAAEKTEAGFRSYLQAQNAEIKGLVVGAPSPAPDNQVIVRLEYVYQERNEAQLVYLQKVGSSWKIARIDTSERVQTLIPYGTPVY